MKRILFCIFTMIMTMALLTGCGASSKKIAEAQKKYQELLAVNNQVAEVYNEIHDDSLQSELEALSAKVDELKEYNLKNMKNSEIDVLIDTMNSIDEAYSGYLKALGEIKVSEDAVALERIDFEVKNETEYVFVSLELMEEGDKDYISNAIADTEGLWPNGRVAGLSIYRDAEGTPWIMTVKRLDGEEEVSYSFVLDEEKLNTPNTTLYIRHNPDTDEMYVDSYNLYTQN